MRPVSCDRTGGAGLGCTAAAARGYGTGVEGPGPCASNDRASSPGGAKDITPVASSG